MKNQIPKILGLMALLMLAPLQAHAAKLALSPATGEFKIGCATAVNIVINTEGKDSMAADAFLYYNPNELDIVDQMSSVPGVQLRPGSVYESYPGNIAGGGVIRLTAFNRQGYFNGRGILGSIVFKAKPGIQTSSIRFDYTPGATTDSNVADVNSNDMLDGVYGGIYSFTTGQCSTDSTPPTTDEMSPAPGDMGVPPDGKVIFNLKDNMTGVDINTVKVQVNDTTYTKNGDTKFTYEGNPNNYKITITPVQKFLNNEPVHVKIDAQDLAGNAMAEKVYSFNELMPVGACGPGNPAAGETLKPAAPTVATGVTSWWPWWFVLLCSLILNLKLWTDRNKARKEGVPFSVEFEKHRITPTTLPKKRKFVKKARR
jgi:Bacterial Ig-like domain